MGIIEDTFLFLIIVITVSVTRIFLYFKPTPSPTLFGLRTHHYMYGGILATLGAVLSNVTLYGIGIGLFLDELTYLLIGGKTHEDNYSTPSLTGTGFFLLIAFIFKEQLLFF